MRIRQFRERLPQGFRRVERIGFGGGIFSGRDGRIFQCPAFALVEFTAMAEAGVDGDAADDCVDPAGKFRAVAEQPQPPIRADKCLLRGFLRQRGVAEATPCDGKYSTFVTFDEFAVAFRIAASNGGHGGFVLLRGLICAVCHFGWSHLTARQPRREIVTYRITHPFRQLVQRKTSNPSHTGSNSVRATGLLSAIHFVCLAFMISCGPTTRRTNKERQ